MQAKDPEARNHLFFAINRTRPIVAGSKVTGIIVVVVQKPIKAKRLLIHWEGM